MSTIVAIRGTNGSGKSTLMRRFMSQMDKRTGRIAWDGKVSGYRFKYLERTVFVLGRYANDCGGWMQASATREQPMTFVRLSGSLLNTVA